MKKIILLSFVLLSVAGSVQAGILSNIFGFNNSYNSGYYYNPSYVRYRSYPYGYNNYYNRNYYTPRYNHRYYNRYPNNYYYRQPVIRRTNVIRKSENTDNIKLVSNNFSGLEKMEKKNITSNLWIWYSQKSYRKAWTKVFWSGSKWRFKWQVFHTEKRFQKL